MLTFAQIQGAIFDVDETLLDTGMDDPVHGMHERARLHALQAAGRRHNLPQLLALTHEENYARFHESPVHSLEGAVWHTLFVAGLVDSEAIEPTNPLLQEIVIDKDKAYLELFKRDAKLIPGASEFVRSLANLLPEGKLAIASTATARDLDLFLELSGLGDVFPPERVISKSKVTHVKPHPEAFDKAFRTLSLPESARSQVLAFEDNPRGIMSAKAAGLFTCAITTIYSKPELAELAVAPDLIADSFAQFRTLLGGVQVSA